MAGQLRAGRKVSSMDLPAPQLLDCIDFKYEPLWKDKDFLHQKYVLEGLSIAQMLGKFFPPERLLGRA